MENRKNILKTGLLLLCFVFSSVAIAQISSTQSDVAERASARLMVVPFNRADEDIRTVLDDNRYIRSAVSIVKQSFDQRGWSTIDFVASLKAAEANAAFSMDRQSSFKSDLISGSGADIYVQVDTEVSENAQGRVNVNLILTAFESHTGASFSNFNGSSGYYENVDSDKLIEMAYHKIREEFLNMLMDKTDEIREIGRALIIQFNLDEEAEMDFDTELDDGYFLNEAIEEWIYTNAFRGRANLSGLVENRMIFDEVRIPLYDQETNRPYNPNRFANEIVRFLRSKNVSATRNIKGQNLFITIK